MDHIYINKHDIFCGINGIYAAIVIFMKVALNKDLNFEQDFYKYIINHEKNIYTTITGLISLHKFDVHIKSNILCGDIRVIFLLKKKYKLPRFIMYLILLETSKLHLKYCDKVCPHCNTHILGKKMPHL